MPIAKKPFDAEGRGYDYKSAGYAGILPKKSHWQSRVARGATKGLLLKGRKHKTWPLTVKGEAAAGYEIYKKDGRYYSRKKPIRGLER